jgi:hypothetical protein
LSGINDVYKGVKPYADTFKSSVIPGGEWINKGLSTASGWIDNVQPYAQKYLIDESSKDQLEGIKNNIKRYGGDIDQKALNNYLDEQDELFNRRGDYDIKEHAVKTGMNAFKELAPYVNKTIFGAPLNRPSRPELE